MFSIGDQIMYGSMGVCTITDIGRPDMPGARECYILRPHYAQGIKVYAPIEDNPVTMRTLLTPEEAKELIDSIPDITSFPASKERNELHETYKSVIKSADSFLLAKLVKTLYEKKAKITGQGKIVPSREKEYCDTAEQMLHGEIAVALEIPIDQVGSYISSQLEQSAAPQAIVS